MTLIEDIVVTDEMRIDEISLNKFFKPCMKCWTVSHIDNMAEAGEYSGNTAYICPECNEIAV